MPFIYSEKYIADIGLHVFPIIKYREIYQRLLSSGCIGQTEVTEPNPATEKQLLTVHTAEYLQDLKECKWTARTIGSELPISKEIIDLFVLAAGGTIEAAHIAIERGWCVHLCGGFHHAFADKAEGFCYVNDLAVAARVVQDQGLVERVAILDCDLHQGNGTAKIFQNDESVFTFSIHQRDLYPIKEKSDWDIHLPHGTSDETYMKHLEQSVPKILDRFEPALVLYQAGADPYQRDQLGNLALTREGLRNRDEFVFKECQKRRVSVAVTLGGGYAINTTDTVEIHCNTCLAAAEILDG
ncbi:histone deacetylase [bacterium]|nr:histone deacetylase [bacterium]